MDLHLNYTALAFLLLGLSIGGNAILLFKLLKSIKAPAPTQDAKELLHHMMGGHAIIRMSVLDPENLMLRSPRR